MLRHCHGNTGDVPALYRTSPRYPPPRSPQGGSTQEQKRRALRAVLCVLPPRPSARRPKGGGSRGRFCVLLLSASLSVRQRPALCCGARLLLPRAPSVPRLRRLFPGGLPGAGAGVPPLAGRDFCGLRRGRAKYARAICGAGAYFRRAHAAARPFMPPAPPCAGGRLARRPKKSGGRAASPPRLARRSQRPASRRAAVALAPPGLYHAPPGVCG